MGSSKKHRKDGEERHREHKKHKHRDKERSGSKRSRERSGRDRRPGRGAAPAEGGPPISAISTPSSSTSRRVKKEKLDPAYEQQQAAPGPKSAAGDASLSIEETNKLRAKLGLKPLELNTVKQETGTKEDPVAAEVINPIALRQREELREKLAAAKEKRLLNQKLGKVKTLGEDDHWLDDTMAWIERSRKVQVEKDMADRRAKLLQEMDEEFGISNLVDKEFAQKKEGYSSQDLQGLTVEHTVDSFREGQTVILTLKDKGITALSP